MTYILYPQPATVVVVLGQKTLCDCCKTWETFWCATGLYGEGDGQISECLVTARTVSKDIRHHFSVGTAVYNCSSSCPPEAISGGGLIIVCRFGPDVTTIIYYIIYRYILGLIYSHLQCIHNIIRSYFILIIIIIIYRIVIVEATDRDTSYNIIILRYYKRCYA